MGTLGGKRRTSWGSDRAAHAIQSQMSGPQSACRERRAGRSVECWSGWRERSRRGRGRLSPSMPPSAAALRAGPPLERRSSRPRPPRRSTPCRREHRPPRETTPSERPNHSTTRPERAPKRQPPGVAAPSILGSISASSVSDAPVCPVFDKFSLYTNLFGQRISMDIRT